MASKRMFAKAIVGSARFLRMGQSTRLLYYDLGMRADDDGIVEAFTVMRETGASEDDLKLLTAKGFVAVLNEDLVSYLCDWHTNNNIRGDRRQPSVYADLLAQFQNGSLIPYLCADSQLPVNCQADVRHLPDKCPADDRQMSGNCRHSIDKDSIDKISIDKISIEKDRAAHLRHRYGQYQNVYLTDEEMTTLQTEFPNDWQQRIETVSEYVASTGKKYKNFLAVIRAWAKKDAARAEHAQKPAQTAKQVYELEGIFT